MARVDTVTKTHYIVIEAGAVWVDGVRKRKRPAWAETLPQEWRGYVALDNGRIVKSWKDDK